MANIFADVSKWQESSADWFNKLKNSYGVKGCMVQITCSSDETYANPVGAYQVYNAYRTFGQVGVYHYFYGDTDAEANVFLKYCKKYGLDKTTLLAIDIEEKSIGSNATSKINRFFEILHDAGYKNFCVYSADSWFNGAINVAKLKYNPKIWIARIGAKPSHKCDAWQYTWTARVGSSSVDLSYDYDGAFTNEIKDSKPVYLSKGSLFEAKSTLNLYNDDKLTNKRRALFAKGSRFYAEPVKQGNVYRLKTKIGYTSANSAYVNRIK